MQTKEQSSNGILRSITHWAVLIGINYYHELPLQGCVQDVQLIRQYLSATLLSADIQVLTASDPCDGSASGPLEPPELWPTYDNVLSKLRRIQKEAKSGDYVYVHYSGHGTKIEDPTQEGLELRPVEDVALDLYDAQHGVRYLKGRTIATLFADMVSHGLHLTVVLDCCFSGSVVRDGKSECVRSLPYDPKIDLEYPQAAVSDIGDETSLPRNANIISNSLIDPRGYSLLTACGPDQRAKEIKTGAEMHGALSFFLVYALRFIRRKRPQSTLCSLYELLRVQFHAQCPNQTPMRYGNPQLSFFGALEATLPEAVILANLMPNTSCIRLHAGYAHGVSPGDEFAIFPFHHPSNLTLLRPGIDWVKTTAIRVGSLTTEMAVITDVFPKTYNNIWKAKLLTSLSPSTIRFLIPQNLQSQRHFLNTESRSRFYSIVDPNTESPQSYHFRLSLNNDNRIEILDYSDGALCGVPTLELSSNIEEEILKLIEHIAAFKYFESLENRITSNEFHDSFTLNLESVSGDNHKALGALSVKEDTMLILTVGNVSTSPLYLCAFDLGPLWQINSIISAAGDGGFYIIPPKSSRRVGFKTHVPDTFKGHGQLVCDDVLKVFITSSDTAFTQWLLPKMDQRFGGGYAQKLSNFLDSLSYSVRDDGRRDQERWATQNFIVHTTASMRSS